MPLIQVSADNGLILIPKAGFSAVWGAIAKHQPPLLFRGVSREQFLQLPRRVLFLREPRARLQSAYRFLRPGEPFSDWVIRVCRDHNGDHHVMPVSELGAELATEVIKWDFGLLASILGVDDIPVLNASAPRECVWSPEATAAFDERYANDLRLWLGLEDHAP
jgi:hypothetical protein